MNNNSKIELNLTDDSHKISVFYLGVILVNLYISNKRNNLSGYEHQAFSSFVKNVYKKIFRNDRNWIETYREMSDDLKNDETPLLEIVSRAIRHGLYGITKSEAISIWKLIEYISMFLPFMVPGGRSDYLSEMRDLILDEMHSQGMLLN